jgi:hypothetical protein
MILAITNEFRPACLAPIAPQEGETRGDRTVCYGQDGPAPSRPYASSFSYLELLVQF